MSSALGALFYGYFFSFHLLHIAEFNQLLKRTILAITQNGTGSVVSMCGQYVWSVCMVSMCGQYYTFRITSLFINCIFGVNFSAHTLRMPYSMVTADQGCRTEMVKTMSFIFLSVILLFQYQVLYTLFCRQNNTCSVFKLFIIFCGNPTPLI